MGLHSMSQKLLVLLFVFGSIFISKATSRISSDAKVYSKEYYKNGSLKAEGWAIGKMKTNYWTFYHKNGIIASKGSFKNNYKNGYWYFYTDGGSLIKEGHFNRGIIEKWWVFYDIATSNKTKIQYKNNAKNGIALYYQKNKLIKSAKYINNHKTGEWTSVFNFRRDNPDLNF